MVKIHDYWKNNTFEKLDNNQYLEGHIGKSVDPSELKTDNFYILVERFAVCGVLDKNFFIAQYLGYGPGDYIKPTHMLAPSELLHPSCREEMGPTIIYQTSLKYKDLPLPKGWYLWFNNRKNKKIGFKPYSIMIHKIKR